MVDPITAVSIVTLGVPVLTGRGPLGAGGPGAPATGILFKYNYQYVVAKITVVGLTSVSLSLLFPCHLFQPFSARCTNK